MVATKIIPVLEVWVSHSDGSVGVESEIGQKMAMVGGLGRDNLSFNAGHLATRSTGKIAFSRPTAGERVASIYHVWHCLI